MINEHTLANYLLGVWGEDEEVFAYDMGVLEYNGFVMPMGLSFITAGFDLFGNISCPDKGQIIIVHKSTQEGKTIYNDIYPCTLNKSMIDAINKVIKNLTEKKYIKGFSHNNTKLNTYLQSEYSVKIKDFKQLRGEK